MNKKRIIYTRKDISTSYIDESERTKLREELQYIESFINDEIRNSLEKEDLEFTLNNVEMLRRNPDAIRVMIEKQKEKYIKSLGFIPTPEKNRIAVSYNDVINRLLPNNEKLYNYLKEHNHVLIQGKSGTICFDPKEVEDHIKTIGIRTFTDAEIDYINTIQDAAELLCKAQHMEVENSFRPYAFGLLVPFGNAMFIDGLARDLSTEIDIVAKFSRQRTLKNNNPIIRTMSKNMSYEEYHKQASDIKFEISYLKTSDQKDDEVTLLKINDLQRQLKQVERNYNDQA